MVASRLPRQRRIRISLTGLIGLSLLLLLLVITAFAPVLIPHDYLAQDTGLRFRPPNWSLSHGYFLGTDHLGRDVLSRILMGSRTSLLISLAAVMVGALLGVPAGLVVGYFGGWSDAVVMRLVELQLAFPTVLLIMAIVAVVGPKPINLVLVLGLSSWAPFCRLARGSAVQLRELDYVEAVKALGARQPRILRHMLINVLSPLTVFASYELARVLLLESSLSFLGMGVQPPTPSWGEMVAAGRNYIFEAWWISTFSGLAIMIAVIAFSFAGDALRDAVDPRQMG